MRGVLVAGPLGSGKTTAARRISAALGIPHIEIDARFHGPGWEPRPSFLAAVAAFGSEDAWVTEWQYSPVCPLLGVRADTLVWRPRARREVGLDDLRQVPAARARSR